MLGKELKAWIRMNTKEAYGIAAEACIKSIPDAGVSKETMASLCNATEWIDKKRVNDMCTYCGKEMPRGKCTCAYTRLTSVKEND